MTQVPLLAHLPVLPLFLLYPQASLSPVTNSLLLPLSVPFILFPKRPFTFSGSYSTPLCSSQQVACLCEEPAALDVSAVLAQVLLVGSLLWGSTTGSQAWFLLQSFASSPVFPSCFSPFPIGFFLEYECLQVLSPLKNKNNLGPPLVAVLPFLSQASWKIELYKYLPSKFPHFLLSFQMVPLIYTFNLQVSRA